MDTSHGRRGPNLNFRAIYGGYIVPGSTLDQALILVSQWGEGDYPYNVQEFVVNLNRAG